MLLPSDWLKHSHVMRLKPCDWLKHSHVMRFKPRDWFQHSHVIRFKPREWLETLIFLLCTVSVTVHCIRRSIGLVVSSALLNLSPPENGHRYEVTSLSQENQG